MAANNYPSPCEKCKNVNCSAGLSVAHKTCNAYRTRLCWLLKRARAALYAEKKAKKEMFRYEHPDMIRKYLQEGPCGRCTVANCDTPCGAYLRWWDARMEVARKKVGCSKCT